MKSERKTEKGGEMVQRKSRAKKGVATPGHTLQRIKELEGELELNEATLEEALSKYNGWKARSELAESIIAALISAAEPLVAWPHGGEPKLPASLATLAAAVEKAREGRT